MRDPSIAKVVGSINGRTDCVNVGDWRIVYGVVCRTAPLLVYGDGILINYSRSPDLRVWELLRSYSILAAEAKSAQPESLVVYRSRCRCKLEGG
jgi:hypothetical protein